MELNAAIKMSGSLTIKQYDADNKLIGDLFVPNLVVTAGKEYIANRMISNTMTPMSHMAIGSSTVASSASQTTLTTEAQRAAIVATTLNGTAITYSSTFPAGTAVSISEAGIFNQPTVTKSVTFDGNLGINDAANANLITSTTPSLHGFVAGDQVRYTNSGGTSVGGLVDGNIYFVIASGLTTTAFRLSATSGGAAIDISPGSGAGHRLTFGTMLCRTTFPVVTKASTDTVVISWTVTVG
jgi:hypothetical protein